MAEKVFDISIGTEVDQSGVENGVKETENILKNSQDKLQSTVQNGGKKQTDTTNKTEKDKTKIVEKESKKRKDAFDKEGKSSLDSIKGFAQGAGRELLGLDQVLGAVAGGPVAMGAAFVKAGKQVIDTLDQWAEASIESMRIQDALNSVIKSTGANAWITASTLNQLARDQSNATGRSTDEITRAQTALLGYTNITKELFVETTKAALDMAQVTGTDMKSAVETLGKALDVPSMGLTALTRNGFRFNEQQKEMVKELESSGRLLEAQRVILDQVVTTYDNAANAVNPAVKAQVAFNNEMSEFKRIWGEDWERRSRGWKTALTNYIKLINDSKRATEGLKNAIKILEEDSGTSLETLQAQVEATRARITLASVQLERQTAPLWKKLLVFNDTLIRDTKSWSAMYQEYIDESNRYLGILEQQAGLLGDIENIVERTDNIAQADGTLEAINNHNQALQLKQELLQELESINTDINITEEMGYNDRVKLIRNAIGLNDELTDSMRERIDALLRIIEIEEREAKKAEEIGKFREDYLEALKKSNAEILRDSYLRNEISKEEYERLLKINEQSKNYSALLDADISSLSLQNSLLNVQTSTYKSLIDASNGLITSELSIEEVIKRTHEALKTREELEKRTDEERKKRLAEFTKIQQDAESALKKIYEQAVTEGDKLYDSSKEQAFQDELVEIRKRSLKEAIEFEAQYRQTQRQIELQNHIAELENKYTLAIQQSKLLEQAELESHEEGSEERKNIEDKFYLERLELEETFNNAKAQLIKNEADVEILIEKGKVKAIEEANIQMWSNLLSAANEFHNAVSSIANSISTIWTNNIDYETNEKLRANKAMIQSDEERAAEEKKILIKAAYERYKAELFAWATNVTSATAQAAMAILNALNTQPFIAGLAMAGLATATGAMHVASVISARPKPPTFHTGGSVQGAIGSEQHIIAKAGESVLTQKQFQNTMQAISNLAGARTGAGGLTVNVENNAANMVTTSQSMDSDGLRVTIERVVGDALSNGRLDQNLALQQQHSQGEILT